LWLEDEENQIRCELELTGHKEKPKDFVRGTITVKGKVVSNIEGSYCSAIRIDGNKYFDWRYSVPHKLIIKKSTLGSNWSLRKDLQEL